MSNADIEIEIDAKHTELQCEFNEYYEEVHKLNNLWTRGEIFEEWSIRRIAHLTLAYENLIKGFIDAANAQQINTLDA